MAFDSSQVREWKDNPDARDVLNADMVDKFCEELIAKHIGPYSQLATNTRDALAASWVQTHLRKYLLAKSPARLIITPREAALGLKSLNARRDVGLMYLTIGFNGDMKRGSVPDESPIVMDPTTLPDFVHEKIRIGLPVYWLEIKKDFAVPVDKIVHYVRFKAKCNPFIKDSVEQVMTKVEARQRQAFKRGIIRELTSDAVEVPSAVLKAHGYYAVRLTSVRAFKREGFLMRNCIHSLYGGLVGDTDRMISIRKVGVKRPIGDLQIRKGADNDSRFWFYTSFAGFANQPCEIPEKVLQAFAQELGLKNIPKRMNVPRTRFDHNWSAFGDPRKDFEPTPRMTDEELATQARDPHVDEIMRNRQAITTTDFELGNLDSMRLIVDEMATGRISSSPHWTEREWGVTAFDYIEPLWARGSRAIRDWADHIISLVPPERNDLPHIQSISRILRPRTEGMNRRAEFVFNTTGSGRSLLDDAIAGMAESMAEPKAEEPEPRSPWHQYDPQLLLTYTPPRRPQPDFWYTSLGIRGLSLGGSSGVILTNMI